MGLADPLMVPDSINQGLDQPVETEIKGQRSGLRTDVSAGTADKISTSSNVFEKET